MFATKEHPLVLFLDDLQWADSASLDLQKLLMDESEAGHLLILGAYRDNEVFPAHPLMLTLDELQKQGATLNTITLAPLKEVDIDRLVADTLLCSIEIAVPLSQLVYQKTGGNPFFTTQFLQGLYEEDCITFDVNAGYWQCDLTQVRQLVLTDDVVTFMVGRLQKLPKATQEVLKLAACIGNRFDLSTLAVVCERSQDDIASDLWQALQQEFVIPESETYKFFQGAEQEKQNLEEVTVNYRFLHDRVQQAAYSLIPTDRKQATHYHIGQLLLQEISPEARESRIFEVVNQLNYGTHLIAEQTERDELARLNLIACHKAKSSTAYQAGREYASTGLSLLGEQAWQRQYEMSLAFYELAAEFAYLCGKFEQMDRYIDRVIQQSHSLPEQIGVYRIAIQAHVSQGRSTEAVEIACEILKRLGATLNESPTPAEVQQGIEEVRELIGDRKIRDLVDLPVTIDAEKQGIVQIAIGTLPAAIISGSPLFPLLVFWAVKLSIQYGNTPASAFGYAIYGLLLCNVLQDISTATQFGQLATQVVSKLDAKAAKPQVLDILSGFIVHRQSHVKKTLPILKEGYGAALEVGSLEFAGYTAHKYCLHSWLCGRSLVNLERDHRTYCNGLIQLNQLTTANYCKIYWQTSLNLLGETEQPIDLSGEAMQETEFESCLISNHDFYGLSDFYLHKLILCYLFEDLEAADRYAVESQKYLKSSLGFFSEPVFYFYDALTALAQLETGSIESLKKASKPSSNLFDRAEQNRVKLQQCWAKEAPMNHQHKVDLIEAEQYRVLGQRAEAIEQYDKAISNARAYEYIQEEALAQELAAKFYLDWGKEKVAAGYMQEAYYSYARWGAKAKTKQLEQTYPQLLAPILQKSEPFFNLNDLQISTTSSVSGTVTTATSSLDLASAIKASRAISEEIEHDALRSKLMQVVVENAGADTGSLILNSSDAWGVTTHCISSEGHRSNPYFETSNTLPHSIINTVKRTKKSLIINHVERDRTFVGDPYFLQQSPKSLLCTPILNQGKLVGILYLENQLTAGAFTPNRVELLNLLTAQAAISLENARLYTRLEDYSHDLEFQVEQRTQELQEKNQHLQQTIQELQRTQTQLIQAEKMSSLGQMVAGIAHEINNPINFIAGNIDLAREYFRDLLDLLQLYEQNTPELHENILHKIEAIDLDFLCDDLNKLLNSMENGSDRIRKIILSLRNFSRLDESEVKEVDLHEGLDNTLLILQHRLKARGKHPAITVLKNYGQLPLIRCYASQLNQVFLNLLSNAIDVLAQSDVNASPEICLTTETIDTNTARIRIADNGPGMSEKTRQRAFDPFFTTKPVGQGTGLGLSISYQIVTEQHGGQLQCLSQSGTGTEFWIDLPLLT
ncbi:MAG: GAF domain-containing protein [Cyanobacteria bacterium SID2]|nr:GAF domain-containing protein [Cyanobacteria bacterium SID2]